jgi:hypothetical protein
MSAFEGAETIEKPCYSVVVQRLAKAERSGDLATAAPSKDQLPKLS